MNDPVATLLEDALRLHRQGAVAKAIDLYREALRIAPDNADACYYLATAIYRQNDFQKAADWALRAIASAPRDARAHRLLGLVWQRLGRLADALASLDQAIACAPSMAEAWGARGDVLVDLGRTVEAIDSYDHALALQPASIEDWCNRGAALDKLGRYQDAAESYDRAIALKPDLAEAHYNRAGALARLASHEDALAAYDRALELRPAYPDALNNRGLTLKALKRDKEAFASFEKALELRPAFVEALVNRGVALKNMKRHDEARASYERALAAKPDDPDALANLAFLCMDADDLQRATRLLARVLALRPTLEARLSFAECIKMHRNQPVEPDVEPLVAQALSEAWARPSELAPAATAAVKRHAAVKSAIDRSSGIIKSPLGAADLDRIAGDRLLCDLLTATPVCDAAMERLLTELRRVMLDLAAADAAVADGTLAFCCAISQQCFINNYVFAVSQNELQKLRMLQHRLDQTAPNLLPSHPLWIAAIGAYVPLATIATAPALRADSAWPAPVQALIRQQVEDPRTEQRLRSDIDVLTPTEDVSREVQRQYEEMPYPRWVKSAAASPARRIDDHLRDNFPAASFQPLGRESTAEILIAGCGTGRHPIEFVQQIADCQVLAIDLSLASLSYAKRKAIELGLGNITFAQADIVRLPSLDRTFDVIDSAGVLHHLADPMAGWRGLVSMLRPGGFMHIGLYSAAARQPINAARRLIAARGFHPTAHDIRRFRQELLAKADAEMARVMQFPDFYSTHECRDLLFHVQEHQMTLPDIKAFLAQNSLTMIGFHLDRHVRASYAQRFPSDPAMTDLDNWHSFETENPEAFIGMYQFWLQKAAD
jgi:tetratricopeptide (TPR) repeat protein/SAM-dependent methyltransferase